MTMWNLQICRLAMFGTAWLLFGGHEASAQVVPEVLPLQTEHSRREISPDKPMFDIPANFWVHDWSNEEQLKSILPEDVRDYVVLRYHPLPFMRLPNNEQRTEALIRRSNEAGIYCWLVNQGHRADFVKPMTREFKEHLFKTYPYFLGFDFAEPRAHNKFFNYAEALENLELAAQYGGYLVLQSQGQANLLQNMIAENPEFLDTLRKYGDHIIHAQRNNSIGVQFSGMSDVLGAWQTGLAKHWGFVGQPFAWEEGGLTSLFGKETSTRVQRQASMFSYPSSLKAMEWLEAAAMGATVFSFEGWEEYANLEGTRLNPTFKYCLLPLMRKMIHEKLISPKDEVLRKTSVAYQKSGVADPHRTRDRMFAYLYGPRYDDTKEWMPYTGRYARIPFLPSTATEGERGQYKQVFTKDTWPKGYGKVNWFNETFPATGKGDSWFLHINGRWFVFNPHINQNMNTDFEIPLAKTAVSLSGVFTPHTFAIIAERASSIKLHLSNYRVNADKDLWTNPPPDFFRHGEFSPDRYDFINRRALNPPDDELRENIIRLHGLDRAPRIAAIDGGEPDFQRPFEHNTKWDQDSKTYTIRLLHNGPVDLEIDTAEVKSSPLPGNLAIFGTVTASSHASMRTIPDRAIDGNDRSSRWEALSDPSDSSDKFDWLEVDLRASHTINRVVLKEYLDRITNYRLEVERNGKWVELASGASIGPVKTIDFAPVTAQTLRLVIIDTKPDSYGKGSAPALHAFEVYGDEPGLSAPRPATASDVYEAEEDAILSGDAELVMTANADTDYRYRNFGAGLVRVANAGTPAVKFLMTAPEDGVYRLGLRYARAEWFGTGDGFLNLYVNDSFIKTLTLPQRGVWDNGWIGIEHMRPRDSWDWWRMLSHRVELKKGVNVIEYRNEYGDFGCCNIDHLQVTKVTAAVPRPMPKLPPPLLQGTRYDGGSAIVAGGTVINRSSTGFSGDGYADIRSDKGQCATFIINALRAGPHKITLRYGFPPGWVLEKERSVSVYVNGAKVIRHELSRGPGSNWQTIADGKWALEHCTTTLEKGENTVEYRVAEEDTGNVLIDSVIIAPVASDGED